MRKEGSKKTDFLKKTEKRFEEIKKIFKRSPKLGKRNLKRLKRMAMRKNITLPKHIKNQYCKNCFSVFFPGKNCKIRIKNKRKIIECFECGTIKKINFT